MVQRQVPKPADVFELMQFKKPEFNGRKRRLAAALTIDDLRTIAKRRTPKAAVRLHRRRRRGRALACPRPPGVRGHRVPPVDPARRRPTSTRRREILGGPSALPFGIAPTGFTRLMQTEGEIAGAGAAGRRRHPVHPLDARHDLDRGRQGGQPARAQLVPALRHARPRDLVRPRRARRRRRLRHAACSRSTPRSPARACATSATASRSRRSSRLGTIINAIPRPWWWSTSSPPRSSSSRRCRRPAARSASCSTPRWTRRSSFDDLDDHPRHLARQDRRQGRAERRGRQSARRPRRRRHRPLEPRRPPARPRADPVPPAARRRARGRQGHRGA